MTKKKENLKGIDVAELKKNLTGLREDLRVMRFKVQGGKSKNVKEAMSTRKQIARLLTEINKNIKNK